MKKKEEQLEFKFLLADLYKKMHNWWWLGVQYDWEMNKETGKVWIYKDCTGVEIKAKEIVELRSWLEGMERVSKT